MRMHLLSGGRLRMRRSIYFPVADRTEMIEIPVSSALLRHPQGNVLFDTGCHPAVADDTGSRWGGLARIMIPIMARDDNVLTGLSGIGLSADDIDVVICSHLHPDHCGCNAFFKRATVIIHEKELAAARAVNADRAGYVAADWDQPLPVDELTGERDLFGDDRIVLIPMPGHTPGTTAALVRLERNGAFLLASDTVSLRATLDTGVVPRNTWSVDMLLKSLAEVRRLEASGAIVLCGHDDAQWTTLRKGANFYD